MNQFQSTLGGCGLNSANRWAMTIDLTVVVDGLPPNKHSIQCSHDNFDNFGPVVI